MKNKRVLRLLALLLMLSLLPGLIPLARAAETATRSLRVHYQNDQSDYADLGVWFWADVVTPSEKTGAWPGGRTVFPPENLTESGVFLDIPLKEGALQVGVLVIDAAGGKRTPSDLMISLPSPEIREVWINDLLEVRYEDPLAIPEGHIRVRYLSKAGDDPDTGVWFWGDAATPSEKSGPWPTGATPLLPGDRPLGGYVDIELIPDAKTLGFLFVNRATGAQTKDYSLDLTGGARVVYMREGDDQVRLDPFEAAQAEREPVKAKWQETDSLYATDSPLGGQLMPDGSAVLRLWAPTADSVEVRLYSPQDQSKILEYAIPMARNADQVWEVTLDEGNTGMADLTGVFYHYLVSRGGEQKTVLDPYAVSMAAWNSGSGESVGIAALVDPARIGPELGFAQIPGFVDREDAIIYEAHVRDFTSDPSLEGELAAPFGTFAAFGERLDYLKTLGITHIQLLPVLSFYHVNELDRERSLIWASENQNYNWGYDPQSWFALTGMYATDPNDPAARIREFKELVSLIHGKGMGVILDVVYNHTAKVELLEDIEPGYYYFMDAQGKPKGSFGGGQVGSTHLMTRRLIKDSLTFLAQTYKVDGFRFDMMGNLDAQTISEAYAGVSALDPKTLFIGEGWRTFNGDSGVTGVTPADQDWMGGTDDVAVFSDEVRNELKSGFGIEGQPRFVTGGPRPVGLLYQNVTARPNNVAEDDPGDIVQYIEAHDNLMLHDVIALSIRKDPSVHEEEILRRQRLANALLLTHQGIIFLHSGQEYGRTKQLRDPAYIGRADVAPAKSTFMTDENGNPFQYPYFIHDSFDSSDAVNMFDWQKALNQDPYRHTREYTQGLIALRRSTDAFSYATAEEVGREVSRVMSPSIGDSDLLIAYSAGSAESGETYLVAVNADSLERVLDLSALGLDASRVSVVVDAAWAGTEPIDTPTGLVLNIADGQLKGLTLEPLTAAVLKISPR